MGEQITGSRAADCFCVRRALADRAADRRQDGARLDTAQDLFRYVGRLHARLRQRAGPRHAGPGEMGPATADPGQDPRGAPDIDPLWIILDTTPEGRGKDWYPKLAY